VSAASRALDLVFRHESGRLEAWLLRRLGPRHFDLAEEAVADAFLAAATTWPVAGTPRDPRAWLLAAAHRKALDRLRRSATAARKAPLLRARSDAFYQIEPLRPDLDDEVAVLLLAAHPALGREAQVAFTLRTLMGLSTREVAQALLVPEATAAQRIVRARKALMALAPRTRLAPAQLGERVASVLDVLYLVFAQGHHASEGKELVRSQLVADALRLATLLLQSLARTGTARASLPSVHALLALMHLQAARLPTRIDRLGELVLLAAQDRARWEPRLLARGYEHLDRSAAGREVSRFHLEAGIAALHAAAPSEAETDWRQILDLYDELEGLWPTPVVRLNRSVAVARVHGPAAGLAALEPLATDSALRGYAPYHAVLGELLRQAGRRDDAALSFERALACPASEPQRRHFARAVASLRRPGVG
jgi:RNA polymerase sigma-70 factor (ECF subfamily)